MQHEQREEVGRVCELHHYVDGGKAQSGGESGGVLTSADCSSLSRTATTTVNASLRRILPVVPDRHVAVVI